MGRFLRSTFPIYLRKPNTGPYLLPSWILYKGQLVSVKADSECRHLAIQELVLYPLALDIAVECDYGDLPMRGEENMHFR